MNRKKKKRRRRYMHERERILSSYISSIRTDKYILIYINKCTYNNIQYPVYSFDFSNIYIS